VADPIDNRIVYDEEAQLLKRRYQWLLQLMREDQTGSLKTFVQTARKQIKKSDGKPEVFAAWFRENWPQTQWFQDRSSAQRESEIQRVDPALAKDFELSLERRRNNINDTAEQYGIRLTPEELQFLTNEARLNQWDDADLDVKLRPYLEATLRSGDNLTGTAGDFQTRLSQWAQSNGLALDQSMIAQYVGNLTLGKQTFEDVKQDLRNTYLAGAYPAWADRIAAGADPEAIAKPYRATAASLLEIAESDVSLNDNLMKRAMQGVGADGKPKVIPLYEFEKQIREDPRWQYTDNARQSYSTMADDLLKMFGFR
jgi:hypothetical protein